MVLVDCDVGEVVGYVVMCGDLCVCVYLDVGEWCVVVEIDMVCFV